MVSVPEIPPTPPPPRPSTRMPQLLRLRLRLRLRQELRTQELLRRTLPPLTVTVALTDAVVVVLLNAIFSISLYTISRFDYFYYSYVSVYKLKCCLTDSW
mmetsp:Transcript_14435/g.34946  ORF Transcript_14435/g.34946 Transcript_14435/m.34946 type:complete len:100 (-) Transcript_14435:29-328(-)